MATFNLTRFKEELQHFTGTTCLYKHSLSKGTYTEGVQFVASQLGAYWLLDLIFLLQAKHHQLDTSFQVWKLRVGEERTATLTMEDGDGIPVLSHDINATDFPLSEFTFWLIDNVLLLPSEY